MIFAAYDDATRQIRYVNCAHCPPMLLRATGEIEQLDSLGCQKQVARLDVSVDQAALMGMLQAQGRLPDVVAGFGGREWAALAEPERQRIMAELPARRSVARADDRSGVA